MQCSNYQFHAVITASDQLSAAAGSFRTAAAALKLQMDRQDLSEIGWVAAAAKSLVDLYIVM